MSQHDMVLDNSTGQAVRLDMNSALQAIVTQNSSPVEPTVKFAGMLWLDTSVAPQGQVRQRNLANTAWITFQIGPQDLGLILHAISGSKAAPADADEFVISDSQAAWVGKRVTWTAVRAYVVALFNSTNKATPVDGDIVYQGNSAASYVPVYSNWSQIKAFLATYFNTLYQPTLGLSKATGQASGIYSHGTVGQGGPYPLQVFAPSGGQAGISFHNAGSFGKNFALVGSEFYEGGWSHGAAWWIMISTRNLPTYQASGATLYGLGTYVIGEVNGQGNTVDYPAGTQIAGAYIQATGTNTYDGNWWDTNAAMPGTWLAMGRLLHPGGVSAPTASLITLFARVA